MRSINNVGISVPTKPIWTPIIAPVDGKTNFNVTQLLVKSSVDFTFPSIGIDSMILHILQNGTEWTYSMALQSPKVSDGYLKSYIESMVMIPVQAVDESAELVVEVKYQIPQILKNLSLFLRTDPPGRI